KTLLIGGLTSSSAGESLALAALEVVNQQTGASRHAGSLTLARIAPKALRLSDGSIFVTGGSDIDGDPVPGAEWLVKRPESDFFDTQHFDANLFRDRHDHDVVSMPGGAVLAVGGCE